MTDQGNRTGLLIAEIQTFTLGHLRLFDYARAATPKLIVGLGSVEKAGKEGHPFTFNQRKEMIETVFGKGAFRFVPLHDINATLDNDDWIEYVLDRTAAVGMPRPTDYFSGSRIDAKWYESRFASLGQVDDGLIERTDIATIYRDIPTDRCIHIVDRELSDIPSGREIRFLIEHRDEEWRRYVPEVLHSYVEAHYPPYLRQAIVGESLPSEGACPVGTRFRLRGAQTSGREDLWPTSVPMVDGALLQLFDDGKWRGIETGDEKAEYSRGRRRGEKQ